MGQMSSTCKEHFFHSYKLKQVNKLAQSESNQIVSNQEILREHFGYIGNQSALYFPYNNIYEDKGWGCAWRAIQMVLSSYLNKDGFADLFYKYGHKDLLIQIVKKNRLYNQQIQGILNQTIFAPQEVHGNWAQPFICKLICEDKNVKSRLFLLNGYPYGNAPKDVFLQTHGFTQFVKIVKQTIKNSPIMIDDSLLSMTILSYKQISQKQHGFIIGDPHIKSNRTNKKVGVYEMVCDGQGRQIRNHVTQETLKQAWTKSLAQTYFCNKNWMVLVTEGWKNSN